MKYPFVLTFLLCILLFGDCSVPKPAVATPEPDEVGAIVENEEAAMAPMDEEFANQEVSLAGDTVLPVYNPSYRREIDLLHMSLSVSFDFSNETVIGNAILSCKAYWSPVKRFRLDAQGFDINAITSSGKPLVYEYDGKNLYINLERAYTRNESFDIAINYVAHPSINSAGGSSAITSDKGLFFIDPMNTDPKKPTQIWTQGETEHNSRWFPTVDKPNERMTEEIFVTVDNKYKTLSNGILQDSKLNPNGTRTDHWTMKLPHAPYLVMLTIGEFYVQKDQWENVPLEYWVEPEYSADAKLIYNNTPEMLGFFSNIFGVKYPWPKLSQVAVRDYVSGAMENTTAIIYGEFVQKNAEALAKNSNDFIVAHEISHHWFGNYVTCESWSNLTLNEGFANYSEYLWFEHKYGLDKAEMHRLSEAEGYKGSAMTGVHPLIHYGYNKNEDMFDAHSYNKGGLILHMLRKYLGDEAFFASLKKYLEKHAFTSVEADNLRQAFEEVTGQDLKWFWNQWFLASGHPAVTTTKTYDIEQKVLTIVCAQTQNQPEVPMVFQFPIRIDIYDKAGVKTSFERFVNERTSVFSFNVSEPSIVDIDPERILLCERNDDDNYLDKNLLFQKSSSILVKMELLQKASLDESHNFTTETLLPAINSEIEEYSQVAFVLLDPQDPQIRDLVGKKALDMTSPVQPVALQKILEVDTSFIGKNYKILLQSDEANVFFLVMDDMVQKNPQIAVELATERETTENPAIRNIVAMTYARAEKTEKLQWMSDEFEKYSGFEVVDFSRSFGYLLQKSGVITSGPFLNSLEKTALDQSADVVKRFACTNALFQIFAMSKNEMSPDRIKQVQQLKESLKRIVLAETDDELKSAYENIPLD